MHNGYLVIYSLLVVVDYDSNGLMEFEVVAPLVVRVVYCGNGLVVGRWSNGLVVVVHYSNGLMGLVQVVVPLVVEVEIVWARSEQAEVAVEDASLVTLFESGVVELKSESNSVVVATVGNGKEALVKSGMTVVVEDVI